MTKQNRAKFGYLAEKDIQSRIDSGDLNAFDVVFTKDSRKIILLSDSLEMIEMRSRVYCFESTAEANSALSTNTDTYEGQIVSIKVDNVYTAYIVNKNYAGKFYVSPLSAEAVSGDLDYDKLGNRPIIRLTGTFGSPIMVADLNTGIYTINGEYKIAATHETVFLSAVSDLFLVEQKEKEILIKKITASDTYIYSVVDGVVTSRTLATTDLLQGYASTSYVDEKISALEILTKQDVENYVADFINQSLESLVESKIEEKLAEGIDEIVDARIDAKIETVEDNSITNLFQ